MKTPLNLETGVKGLIQYLQKIHKSQFPKGCLALGPLTPNKGDTSDVLNNKPLKPAIVQ